MAVNKSFTFEEAEVALAKFAKSMSHAARIRIVALLLEGDAPLSCGELVTRLPLAQSTVSQHLKELVKAEVLQVEADGSTCFYKLDKTQLLNFCRSFQIAMGNAPTA